MTVAYDPTSGTLRIDVAAGQPTHTVERFPGLLVDLDSDGRVLAVEVLMVGQRMGLLTDAEARLYALIGEVWTRFTEIIGEGPNREGDIAEMTSAVHRLQFMLAQQALARGRPDWARLLGLPFTPPPQVSG